MLPVVPGFINALVLPKMQHAWLRLSVVAEFVIEVEPTSILVAKLAAPVPKSLLPARIEAKLLEEAGSTG